MSQPQKIEVTANHLSIQPFGCPFVDRNVCLSTIAAPKNVKSSLSLEDFYQWGNELE